MAALPSLVVNGRGTEMPKRWIPLVALFVFALFVVPAAAAERNVHQVVAAKPDGTVSVEIVSGSVRFVAWDKNEVQIDGTLEEDVEDLDIESKGSTISIEVELVDEDNLHHADAHLEIRVPRGSSIEAESVAAELGVEGISGSVSIESVSGDVEIRGDMVEIEASTVSSDVTVQTSAPVRDAQFESVSGDVTFGGKLDPHGRFHAESVSGDVELRLGSSASADFRVETFSGEIENKLGPPAERSGPYVPAKTLSFQLGGGGAKVTIESFSGTVRLLAE